SKENRSMPKKFSPELRDRAVRMVYDRQALEGDPRSESIRAVAPQLGVGMETLRIWCNRYGPAEPSASPAVSLEEENRRLPRELAESRRANEILKAASVLFARELDHPTTKLAPSSIGIAIPSGSRPSAASWARQNVGSSPLAATMPRSSARHRPERFVTRCSSKRSAGFMPRTTASTGIGSCITRCAVPDGKSAATRPLG